MDDQQKKARSRALAAQKDYKLLFNSDLGKKVLADLSKVVGFLERTHVPGDPHSTAFNDGQKDVLRYIYSKINVDYKKLEAKIAEGVKDERDNWYS
jgi:hypothetical protein